MVNSLTIAQYVLSFLCAFSIGANDAADSMGSSYGSKALPLIWCVGLGSIFEFLGAYFCSARLAGSMVGDIIENTPEISKSDPILMEQMCLGASIATFMFIMCSSFLGMPISCTHSIVGGIIGAGLAGVNAKGINWYKLIKVVVSWFVSPILTGLLSFLMCLFVCHFTLNFEDGRTLNSRMMWLMLLTGFVWGLIAFMVTMLV
jgi:phosphate/sulfate permease